MFGKLFGNRYKPKTACRVHVSKKPSPLKEFMLNTYVFGNVPNKCDVEIQTRWGEGMSVEEWFKSKEA